MPFLNRSCPYSVAMKLVASPGILKYKAGTLPIYWLMLTIGMYNIKSCIIVKSNSKGYKSTRVVKTPMPGIRPANTPPTTPNKKSIISIVNYTTTRVEMLPFISMCISNLKAQHRRQ